MNLDQRLQVRIPIPIHLNNGKGQEYHYNLPTLQYHYNILFSMSTTLFYEYMITNSTSVLAE